MNEKIQQDIEKMQAAIEQLKNLGEELFFDQIAVLQNKIDDLKAEAVATVDELAGQVKDAEQNFVQKYGVAITRAVGITLLALIAGRVFGVI
jgi:GTPase involved in cell partitioning and DNA repair